MKNFYSFLGGGTIGSLGGLIGLGGAEFRLPLLNIAFRFDLKSAIVLNLFISFFTVIFSLLFRIYHLESGAEILMNIWVVFNLLAGSLIGSYFGTNMILRIDGEKLKSFVFLLMLFLASILFFHSEFKEMNFSLEVPFLAKFIITVFSGYIIGVVSSLLGVAGGELIIPTIILIYGVDIKLAGTLSLMVSIPTILISLYKHYRNNRLEIITHNNTFLLYMIGGTFVGSYLGSLAVGLVDSYWLEIFLAGLLLISAVKMKYLKGKN